MIKSRHRPAGIREGSNRGLAAQELHVSPHWRDASQQDTGASRPRSPGLLHLARPEGIQGGANGLGCHPSIHVSAPSTLQIIDGPPCRFKAGNIIIHQGDFSAAPRNRSREVSNEGLSDSNPSFAHIRCPCPYDRPSLALCALRGWRRTDSPLKAPFRDHRDGSPLLITSHSTKGLSYAISGRCWISDRSRTHCRSPVLRSHGPLATSRRPSRDRRSVAHALPASLIGDARSGERRCTRAVNLGRKFCTNSIRPCCRCRTSPSACSSSRLSWSRSRQQLDRGNTSQPARGPGPGVGARWRRVPARRPPAGPAPPRTAEPTAGTALRVFGRAYASVQCLPAHSD